MYKKINMEKKDVAGDLLNPTLEKINFGGKEFKVKRLNIKAILKIASIVGNLSTGVVLFEGEKFNLRALEVINEDDINELISYILKTSQEEVDDLFNIKDFLVLVRLVLKQEDIQEIFLEVSQLTEEINNQVKMKK